MNKIIIIALAISLLLSATVVQADVPQIINYQGRLTDSSGAPIGDTVVSLTFVIYSDTTSSAYTLWRETHPAVTVHNGLFDIILGSEEPIPNAIFDGKVRGLGVQLGSNPISDTLIPLISMPYAYRANYADSAATAGTVADIGMINRNQVEDTAAVLNGMNRFHKENQFHAVTHFYTTVAFHNFEDPHAGINFFDNTMHIIDDTLTIHNNVVRVDNNSFKLFDSAMIARSYGIDLHMPLSVIKDEYLSSPFWRKGILSLVTNSSTGGITSIYGHAYRASLASNVRATYGVFGKGQSDSNFGDTYGVYGEASGGEFPYGVYGKATGGAIAIGVFGTASGADNINEAAYFDGDVAIHGDLLFIAASYRVDHPLDPANKYLEHTFVGSPEMKNVYDGNVVTNADGIAVVTLPDYVESLNKDFRYQLTVIGDFAQAIVSQEIENNQFTIKTNKPYVKVSWQVTGIRNDPNAQVHPYSAEKEKIGLEKGRYLHPELYGQPEEMGITYQIKKKVEEDAIEMNER